MEKIETFRRRLRIPSARLLDAGSNGKIKVDFKNSGTYEMYCPVDGHRAAGMEGKITVK